MQPTDPITVDSSTGEVSIETNDNSLSGINTFQAKATIQVPNDYTLTDFTTFETFQDVYVDIETQPDPCQMT